MTGITQTFYIIIFSLFVFTSCDQKSASNLPETPSEILNDIIRSAEIQTIIIDDFEKEIIQIGKDDILYSTFANHNSGPVLGFLSSVVYRENQFYIYDFTTNAIYTLGLNGSVEGPHTREGKGPGEHLHVENLSYNSGHIFANDFSNARINVYSPIMKPVDVLEPFSSRGDIAINDEIILHVNERSRGFAPSFSDEGLIVVSSVGKLSDTLATLMPRIIPVGYQPEVYNGVKFSLNPGNQIVASYSPLPWLFIFNNQYEHVRTVILEYSAFDELDIPAMDFFRPQDNKGYGGQTPVHSYKLMDNGDLFIVLRRELIYLKKEGTSYQLKGRYSIQYQQESDINNGNDFTWVYNQIIMKNTDTVYVFNPGYIYHFQIEDFVKQ